MKKNIFYFCCILVFFSVLLSGCEKTEVTESESVVVLIGNHANAKMVDEKKFLEEVKDVYMNLGTISFIVVDGEPEIIYKDDEILGYVGQEEMEKRAKEKALNEDLWRQELNPIIERIGKDAYNTPANNNEVDIIKALNETSSALNYSMIENVEYDKRIVIYDSGLSTTGVVNFCEHNILQMSEAEINAFVDELYYNKEIPNLSEVEVEWYGIGKVAEPQQAISNKYCEKIKYLWNRIIEKAGGTIKFIDYIFNITVKADCEVSKVIIPSVSREKFVVYFLGDSIAYNNNEIIAKNVLVQAANEIMSFEGVWYIIGCEATRTEDGVEDLKNHYSALRADKVAKELRKLGVSDSKIIVSALGPYDPWNINEYVDGSWREELAQKNRKVVIIHTENPEIVDDIEFIEEGRIG
ncbi:MAG: hypothetical protein J6Q50_05010 [Clostridia bacterium]|nr:hypothetical protein [Clostridia bacterium]